jgi:transposase-like protein/ribosomal protein L37AE/L43A
MDLMHLILSISVFTIIGGALMYKSINFFQFQKMFSNNQKCWKYLVKRRWPDGYQCPRCQHNKYYFHPKRGLFECKKCRYQVSVTANTILHKTRTPLKKWFWAANTILHKTRTPLKKWFWAIYLVAHNKKGISTLQLQKFLEIKTYKTAWIMVHKIRKAMASREAAYKLSGLIEFDDSYFGGKKHKGKPGRGSENKKPVLVAIEVPNNKKPRYASLQEVPTLESIHIESLLKNKVKDLSILKTDAHKSFLFIPSKGYFHFPKKMDSREKIEKHLPWVHTMVGNVKNAIRSTFHGVSAKHLHRYLDEFNYRFNRRFKEKLLFDRLLYACVITNTITFSELRQ